MPASEKTKHIIRNMVAQVAKITNSSALNNEKWGGVGNSLTHKELRQQKERNSFLGRNEKVFVFVHILIAFTLIAFALIGTTTNGIAQEGMMFPPPMQQGQMMTPQQRFEHSGFEHSVVRARPITPPRLTTPPRASWTFCTQGLRRQYFYGGGFGGLMTGTKLLEVKEDELTVSFEQKAAGTGGLLVGYHFSDRMGIESRLHFSSIGIKCTGQVLGVPFSEDFATRKLTIFDVSLYRYLWSNERFNPYIRCGVGVGQQEMKVLNSIGAGTGIGTDTIVTLPLGVGVRFWCTKQIAVQADITNNIIFSTGKYKEANTTHNVAFTLGVIYSLR